MTDMTTKALRCIVCATELTLPEAAASDGCPVCGTTTAPMPVEWDVQPRVNWVELSLLCSVTDRFCEEHGDELPRDLCAALAAITQRLKEACPATPEAMLLTMMQHYRPAGVPN